jgi:heterogeneous nuclear ribonucleoprotein A1/A3
MKRFMMTLAVLVGMAATGASTAKADHRHYGGRSGSSFSISFGNGFNNFAYSSGRGGYGSPYGGYGGGYGGYGYGGYPVYRPAPVYSVPIYGVPVYGGGYGGYGRGHRHCH